MLNCNELVLKDLEAFEFSMFSHLCLHVLLVPSIEGFLGIGFVLENTKQVLVAERVNGFRLVELVSLGQKSIKCSNAISSADATCREICQEKNTTKLALKKHTGHYRTVYANRLQTSCTSGWLQPKAQFPSCV